MHFIKRYLPDTLSARDKARQRKELTKSRKLYKQGKYYTRKAMNSFKTKPSKHLARAATLYHVDKIRPSRRIVSHVRVFNQRIKANCEER